MADTRAEPTNIPGMLEFPVDTPFTGYFLGRVSGWTSGLRAAALALSWMEEADGVEFALIEPAARALPSPVVRNSERKLASLLSKDFAEIGRSGWIWNHLDSVVALRSEDSRELPAASEWRFNAVSPKLFVVTNRIHGVDGDSWHCSPRELASPVLRFHQKTMISVS